MLPLKYSFKLISRKNFSAEKNSSAISLEKIPTKDTETSDDKKRAFLKMASIAGVGLVASQMLPKKADALILGSTPSSNVVGVKNKDNIKVNPATEETVATLATEATLANVATEAALANVATEATLSTRASEATLSAIKTNSDKFLFDINGNLLTAQTGGASAVTIKDISGNQINPATEESNILLRRLLKQVDSLSTIDSAQRQKVTLDSITSGLTLANVSTVSTLSNIAGIDYRYMYTDTARNAYANGIRNNLTF